MNEQYQRKFKSLKIYITGYGIFEGVENNPSELLVNKIQSNIEQIHHKFGKRLEIEHTEIMKVAIQEVNQKTQQLYQKINDYIKSDDEVMHLIIHFGVDMGAKSITLESRCSNLFEGHDVEGFTINGKINKENSNNSYLCKLDLLPICSELNKSHLVEISKDAGTYLCNYVYFLSSQKWHDDRNVHSIFIHVPHYETICVDKVYDCFFDFLSCVMNKYIYD